MFHNEKIIFETDTALDHYQVVERRYEGRPARVLFSGHRHAAQSGIALDADPDLLFDYNQRFLELVSAVYPKRLLLIGGGAFTLPMALVQALPELQVDVVELDPGLIKLATDHFGLQLQPRLKIIIGDGREYLEAATARYDIILIDAYSHLIVPYPLTSRQAITKVHRLLTPHGLIASNIIATYQGRTNTVLRAYFATYGAVFEKLSLYPAAYDLSTWLPQNFVLVGQKDTTFELEPYMRYAPLPVFTTASDEVLED